MEIRAKVALTLPNKFYKVILRYDTFEKATYDAYLIASVVVNSTSEAEAFDYINDITGDGSLNAHFKKLYKKISGLTPEQVKGILKNSLFPVTVIDKTHHFKYYEMFDATRMDNKVFPGNLERQNNLLINLVMPKDENAKFLDINFETEDGLLKKDNYNAIFSEEGIKVDLDNNNYLKISNEAFKRVFESEELPNSVWMPKIKYEIKDGNWNVLTADVVNAWDKEKFIYKNEEGNLAILYNDYIKIIEVVSAYELLFYKETRYDFTRKNRDICQHATEYLLRTGNINTYKTRSLIQLVSLVSDLEAQKVVQYILSRKNSKEFAEFGIKLIKNGLELHWEKEVLLRIKALIPQNEFKYLYKINSDLNFEISDLLNMDESVLNEADKIRVHAYIADKENILKAIKIILGDIATSGVREKLKKLQKDEVVNSVKKFLNEYQGHNVGNLEELSNENLKKEYNKILTMYNNQYAKVKERCNKLND